MNKVAIFALLLLAAPSFAVIIESGDNGEQFAQDTIAAQCNQENVQAVYHCFGNVVKVVSSLEGQGSTFYKPDGNVVHCPVVAPTELGAECLQMMAPNYCPSDAACGGSPEQIFPGQNGTPEQTGDEDYYVDEEQEVVSEENQTEETVPEVIAPEPEPQKPVSRPPAETTEYKGEEEIPAATENKVDNLLSDLTIVIIVLGLVAVGILFMLFKKSINE
jgi:hypothetical protein